MAASTYVIALPHSISPTLHTEWCPHAGNITLVIGSFVGCFTAMSQAKILYTQLKPCPYCCGAIQE